MKFPIPQKLTLCAKSIHTNCCLAFCFTIKHLIQPRWIKIGWVLMSILDLVSQKYTSSNKSYPIRQSTHRMWVQLLICKERSLKKIWPISQLGTHKPPHFKPCIFKRCVHLGYPSLSVDVSVTLVGLSNKVER